MSPTKIKIAVAEDHNLVRDSLMIYLKHFRQLDVLWGVANGRELLNQLETSTPDIVLLDIDMPVMGGHEVLGYIKRDYPQIKVIILSMHFDYFYLKEFIERGANAFLPKDCRMEKLLKAIDSVFKTGKYLDEEATKLLERPNSISAVHTKQIRPTKITLTDRELRIIELLRSNKTNEQIAAQLCISKRTVEGNRAELMKKTGCTNLGALVGYAIENEWIPVKAPTFYQHFINTLKQKLKSKVT
jgi:DNA-binding NarL/FixJ family response regulator